ncbi:preprotein translocase subunit YajC [Caulifigura coniformis]|uniref:Sec translocon accessory complex subunit YajC n=1 Tax=Caulifigura coniformis TaxID=2527983 RepID=A0A517SC45_9PLAN|nr:preprotein translocase subunit YajC [Caulifigura coniformis]QDT53710.1 preprotein translocase subunit YajC [Caulifigura coniformis]
MWNWLTVALVLAQAGGEAAPAAAPAAGEGAAQQPPGTGSMIGFFAPILLAFMVMMWMNSRQSRKDQDRKRNLIQSLKKNDQVVTIGGIIGTFVSRSEDGLEVTLRMVDDSRIKFRADAIRDVLSTSEAAHEKS